MKTNILVQYDGGGYSGCFWEWNYFYIDKDGKFHDIQSSGIGGITTRLAAMLLIDNDGNDFSNKVYVYSLDSEKDMKAFVTECNPHHILGVVRWFGEHNDPDIELLAICSQCGQKISDQDDIPIEGGGIICPDCHSAGWCACCDEYVGPGCIKEVDAEEYGHEHICLACEQYHDLEKQNEERRALRFQSLCTGKPDMFSDEMRWHWI